jgi:hypothetical protein
MIDDVTYLAMVQQFAIPQADRRLDTIFVLEGCAARHIIDHVVQVSNETFADRWVGRGGLIAWPPQITRSNLLRFLFMGVYQIEQQDCRSAKTGSISADCYRHART